MKSSVFYFGISIGVVVSALGIWYFSQNTDTSKSEAIPENTVIQETVPDQVEIIAPDGHILAPHETMEVEYTPSEQPLSSQGIDRVEVDGRGQSYSIAESAEPQEKGSRVWIMNSEKLRGGTVRESQYNETTGQWSTVYIWTEE